MTESGSSKFPSGNDIRGSVKAICLRADPSRSATLAQFMDLRKNRDLVYQALNSSPGSVNREGALRDLAGALSTGDFDTRQTVQRWDEAMADRRSPHGRLSRATTELWQSYRALFGAACIVEVVGPELGEEGKAKANAALEDALATYEDFRSLAEEVAREVGAELAELAGPPLAFLKQLGVDGETAQTIVDSAVAIAIAEHRWSTDQPGAPDAFLPQLIEEHHSPIPQGEIQGFAAQDVNQQAAFADAVRFAAAALVQRRAKNADLSNRATLGLAVAVAEMTGFPVLPDGNNEQRAAKRYGVTGTALRYLWKQAQPLPGMEHGHLSATSEVLGIARAAVENRGAGPSGRGRRERVTVADYVLPGLEFGRKPLSDELRREVDLLRQYVGQRPGDGELALAIVMTTVRIADENRLLQPQNRALVGGTEAIEAAQARVLSEAGLAGLTGPALGAR